METSLKFCPLKLFTSPSTRGKRRQAMTMPHRGCKGDDNCLVNYLCVLFFLFLGKAGSLVGMGV